MQATKMFYILDKQVRMPFIFVNEIPIFYENGKVYYIYKQYPIGSYTLPNEKSNQPCNVFDLKGRGIGKIEWEDESKKWTIGSLWTTSEPYATVKENARRYSMHNMETNVNSEYSKWGKACALNHAIYSDSSWNNEVAKISSLGSKDTWGATAAYICLQAYDLLSNEGSFYNL